MHFGCHCAFRRPGQQKCIQMLSAVDLRFSSFYPGNVWGSAGGPTQTGRRFLYGWITPQFLQRTNQVTVILLHPLISTKSKTVATNEKKSSCVFFPARGWLLMVELKLVSRAAVVKKGKGLKVCGEKAVYIIDLCCWAHSSGSSRKSRLMLHSKETLIKGRAMWH